MLNEQVYEALAKEFGCQVHWWPYILEKEPRFWQRKRVHHNRKVNSALKAVGLPPIDDGARKRFWTQIKLGQGYREDAGGYFFRCWCAALELPFTPVEGDTYSIEGSDYRHLYVGKS